jgi:hypothetical protein
VVDAGADVVDLRDGHADVAGQLLRRALHAVTEAHGLDAAVARLSAQQFIAIGLTYWRKVTSGQSSSMSRHMSRKTGIVRSPRMMPPMPSVSAMVWRRPYFLGISKSVTVPGL